MTNCASIARKYDQTCDNSLSLCTGHAPTNARTTVSVYILRCRNSQVIPLSYDRQWKIEITSSLNLYKACINEILPYFCKAKRKLQQTYIGSVGINYTLSIFHSTNFFIKKLVRDMQCKKLNFTKISQLHLHERIEWNFSLINGNKFLRTQ